MLAVINEGLMLVPYGRAAPVVAEINRQIQAQFDTAKDENIPTGGSPVSDEPADPAS